MSGSNTGRSTARVRWWVAAWITAGVCLVALLWLSSGGGAGRVPEVLRIGLPPDLAADRLAARYGALSDFLSAQTGIAVEIHTARNYQSLIDDFSAGRVDLARFGGASYVIARGTAGAVPLVMREVDTRFTSVFISRAGGPEASLDDFSDQVMAFGDPLSTSGHLMPRHHLRQLGFEPEQFFEHILFTGAHDATALAVVSGKADLGALNALVFRQLLADGTLDPDVVQVVWESPPYPDYVWAASPGLDDGVRDRIRDAFLSLSVEDTAQAAILKAAGTTVYLPAIDIEMEVVEKALREREWM